MTTVLPFLVAFVALTLTSCGRESCEALTPAKAEAMAVREKAGRLSRTNSADAANFESDKVVDVRTNTEGHAAKVVFLGKDGWTLVALVKNDCDIAWSEVPPHPTP